MTEPPPTNLMEWPKGKLAAEVARLRSILREHSEHLADPPTSGGDFADVAGDPHARGGVVLDTRSAVLMDSMNVMLVDTQGEGEPPAMAMVLEGRVNLSTRRTKQMFLFGADGAAALCTELVGLVERAGGEFAAEFVTIAKERLEELP